MCSFSFFFFVLPAQAQIATVDSDLDGLKDEWEVQIYGTDPHKADTDGDSYNDRQEILQSFNPIGKGNYKPKDFDGDRLDDRLEILFGTDPIVNDTDGDGFLDGLEVNQGFSPTNTQAMVLPKTIKIHLSKQRMEKVIAGVPVASFPVSTGKPGMRTPVGEFKILDKHPRAWSRSAKLWMPYWMHFSGRGHGIHELPEWPGGKKEGQNHLGLAVSHGCVRLGVGPAKEMYDWAPIGTAVSIVR